MGNTIEEVSATGDMRLSDLKSKNSITCIEIKFNESSDDSLLTGKSGTPGGSSHVLNTSNYILKSQLYNGESGANTPISQVKMSSCTNYADNGSWLDYYNFSKNSNRKNKQSEDFDQTPISMSHLSNFLLKSPEKAVTPHNGMSKSYIKSNIPSPNVKFDNTQVEKGPESFTNRIKAIRNENSSHLSFDKIPAFNSHLNVGRNKIPDYNELNSFNCITSHDTHFKNPHIPVPKININLNSQPPMIPKQYQLFNRENSMQTPIGHPDNLYMNPEFQIYNLSPFVMFMHLNDQELSKYTYQLAKYQVGCRYLQMRIEQNPPIANLYILPSVFNAIN